MPNVPPRICVVGSSNVDLIFRTPRLPRLGETLPAHGFHVCFGGKGANQAVMAAKLGGLVTMISRVGHDDFGERTLANFRAFGIDTSHVSTDAERPTGVAGIIVDDAANNCILLVRGANEALSPENVRAAADLLRAAHVVVAQCETPLNATLEAFRIAKPAGAITILNPAPAIALDDELPRLTDYCIPNETELAMLTGQPADTLEDVQCTARLLLQRGTRHILVTLGVRGALLVTEAESQHVPAPSVTAVDSTGAGDAFIGGFAVALGERRPLLEAIRWATAGAALSVTRAGTQPSFPTRGEVESFQPAL